MRKRHCFFAISVLSSLLVNPARSVSVEYHISSPARLGYGLDPSNPFVLYVQKCLDEDGEEPIDTSGIVGGDAFVSIIHSYKELMQSMGMSVSADVQATFANAAASFSQNNSYSFTEDSLVWTVRANMTLGRFRLKNIRPSEYLRSLSDASAAIRACGPEIVTQESRGAIVSIVYQATNLSIEQKNALSSAIAASYNSGASSGSISAKYSTVVEEIRRTSTVSGRTFVQGGPGGEVLAAVVGNTDDLDKIKAAVVKYIQDVNSKNAKPLQYQTSPLSAIDPYIQIKSAPHLNEDRLLAIYELYIKLDALISRIDHYISPTGEDEGHISAYVSDKQRAELQLIRDQYEGERDALFKAATACIARAAGCDMPRVVNLTRIAWPSIPAPPYLAEACDSAILFGLRTVSGPDDEVIQSAPMGFVLLGDSTLFKSVWKVQNTERVPLERRKPPVQLATGKFRMLDTLFCKDDLDYSNAFGAVVATIPRRFKKASGVRLEVVDIFGRVSSLDVDARVSQ